MFIGWNFESECDVTHHDKLRNFFVKKSHILLELGETAKPNLRYSFLHRAIVQFYLVTSAESIYDEKQNENKCTRK